MFKFIVRTATKFGEFAKDIYEGTNKTIRPRKLKVTCIGAYKWAYSDARLHVRKEVNGFGKKKLCQY